MILDVARAQTMKKARHLQHPLFCLDAIRIGVEQGGHAGLRAVSLDVHRNVQHDDRVVLAGTRSQLPLAWIDFVILLHTGLNSRGRFEW